MDAGGARQKLFVISLAVILGTAAWLPFAGSASRPLPNPSSPTVTRLSEPEQQSDVPGFIAACWAADAEEIPRLRELAQTENPLVVGRAIAALGRLRGLHDDPRLLNYLRDPRDRVRHETIIGLGSSGERHVVHLSTSSRRPMVGGGPVVTTAVSTTSLHRTDILCHTSRISQ